MRTQTVCIGIPVRERTEWTAQTLARLREFTRDIAVALIADGLDAPSRAALEKLGAQVIAWDRTLGNAACFNWLVQNREADVYVLLENGACVAPRWLEHIERALVSNPEHGIAGPSTNIGWNEQPAFPHLQTDAISLSRTAQEAEAKFGAEFTTLAPLHSVGDFCYAVTRKVIDTIGAADEAYADGPCWEMDYNIRAARAGFAGIWVKSSVVARVPQSAQRRVAEERRFLLNKRRYQEKFCGLHLRKQTRGYDAHCTGEACPHFAPRDLTVTRMDFPVAAAPPAPATSAPPITFTADTELPLVSCIMPTANRRPYVAQAISDFLAQDYVRRELIIVDDGADNIEDLVPTDPRIHYLRIAHGQSLGAKRNEACRRAQGEIIVHWDDDDWHAQWRLSYQVGEMLAKQADICGLDRLWFYDEEGARAWQYLYRGRPRWLAGGSFCYRRRVWERRPFADVTAGEDTRFVREAPFKNVLVLARDDFYVARVHARNTCRKQTGGSCWRSVSAAGVRAMIESIRPQPHVIAAADSNHDAGPLVSCIMPTRDRAHFVPRAIELFQRQSYANRELVIVDDGDQPVSTLLPAASRIRHVRLPRRVTLGEKRNLACEAARGEVIVHWDDDDWYGADRLTAQLAPLIRAQAEVSALSMTHVLSLRDMRFWRCRPAHHARIHWRNLCPGTVAYLRRLWTAGTRYAAINCAEDVAFLSALPTSVNIARIADEHHFVCVRHSLNTWAIRLDWQRAPSGWESIAAPTFMSETDVAWYRAENQRVTARAALPVAV